MPSNMPVMSAHVIRPWRDGQHKLLREGQITFIAREPARAGANDTFRDTVKEVSLQHLNSICSHSYAQARDDLRNRRLPAVAGSLTEAEFDAISEADLEEYIGSPEREDTIPEDDLILRQAVKLLHVGHFKYLRPCGVRIYWNLFGGLNNTSSASIVESKVQRDIGETLVVNNVVGKKVFLSNIWGDNKHVSEGCRVGLILRRGGGGTLASLGNDGAPEYVPWSDRDAETPSMPERAYFDEHNRFQYGHYLPIGVCQEVTGEEPSERKRREAIGNGNQLTSVVHDAIGTLPQIVVGWGHP